MIALFTHYILLHFWLAAEQREMHKQQTTKEMKKRADMIRWIAIIVILIMAAIGLYYYFNYTSSGLPATRRAKQASTKAGKEKRTEGRGTTPKTSSGKMEEPAKSSSSSSKKATAKKSTKTDTSSSSQGKKETKSQTNPKTTKQKPIDDAKKEQIEPIDLRVLRRPYSPDDPDRPHLVDLLSGDNLILEGKYTLAMEKFNEVLKHFPQSTRALYGKGVALRHMAREKRSNKLLDTAVDFFYKAGMESFMGSEDVRIEALYELADTAHERGKTQLAIRALEKVVEYKKDDVDAMNRLGMGYMFSGNYRKAKTQFKKALEQFPNDHFAKAQLGFILYSEKKYEEALPKLMEGIREDEAIKKNPKFYIYAGETLTRLNRSDEVKRLPV